MCIHDGTGRCVGRLPRDDETVSPVLFFRPALHPHVGFMFCADDTARPISVGQDPDVQPAISLISERCGPNDAVFLRLPTSDLYICAVPAEVSSDADLCCNRLDPGGWEMFNLLSVDIRLLPESTRVLMETIQAAFVPTITAAGARKWLVETPIQLLRHCAIAVLRTLPPHELRILAGWLLDDDTLFEKLRNCLAADLWTRRIVELRHWNTHRPALSHLALDESWDRCAVDFGWHRNVSFGEIMLGLMREHVRPTRTVCVMTTARNEGLYLLEWIAHHRALGIEHFFIYTNQNNDGSDLLLDHLARLGLITWVTNSISAGVNPQARAYTHCLSHLTQPLDYKWTILIDLDEFITFNPDRYTTIGEFLDHQEARGADAVSMHWSMLTPSGQSRWSPEPMLARFTHREPWENRHVKSAFVTARHVASYPHNPVPSYKLPQKFLNAAGQPHHLPGSQEEPHQGEPNFEHAWISHYFYKSLDEWIWKMSRGFDARDELAFDVEKLEPYLRWFDPANCEPDSRALHHLGALKPELERLRSIPSLADAEAKARRMFLDRVGSLKELVIARIKKDRVFDTRTRTRVIALLRGGPAAWAS